MEHRKYTITRETKETYVYVRINIDGNGNLDIDTGIKFLDHLINALCKHSLFDVEIKSKSKDHIQHHIIEDIAISLGTSINNALGARSGIRRFGFSLIPMDDALVESSIDLIQRPYHNINLKLNCEIIEDLYIEDITHFLESLIKNICACVHINTVSGTNSHHIVEAAVKSLAVSLRNASSKDERQQSTPSTKGTMS